MELLSVRFRVKMKFKKCTKMEKFSANFPYFIILHEHQLLQLLMMEYYIVLIEQALIEFLETVLSTELKYVNKF